ncbi:MAG TPA: hypothetical protein VFP72_03815 [Kineosporiaceae bacterium]|nr:hypothetical protein [Kineosporiaceae bacterium]
MSLRQEEARLIELLRHAGTDVVLDRERILRKMDRPSLPAPRAVRGRGSLRSAFTLQRPFQMLALPLATAAAVLFGVIVSTGGMLPKATASPAMDQGGDPESTITSSLAPAVTETSSAKPSPTPVTSSATPSATSSVPQPGNTTSAVATGSTTSPAATAVGSGLSVAVTPVAAGAGYRLPLQSAVDWFAVTADGSQPRKAGSPSLAGPAQAVGSGQVTENGPFAVSWAPGALSSAATDSSSWLTVPGATRGVPGGLKIPVRLQRVPATITLLTGTTGGGGTVKVALGAADGPHSMEATLPSCSGPVCPAVVTVKVDGVRIGGSAELVIELTATTTGKVGLAAVELD